jgi:hypothetical protein
VTTLGRITAVGVMFAGVGIIGSLASILASVLVPPPKAPDAPAAEPASTPPTPGTVAGDDTIAAELASIRAELVALRQSLASGRATSGGPSPTT